MPPSHEFRAEIQASEFGLAAEIAVDCLVNLRDSDVVLVARRRDLLDLVSQVGVPLIQGGRDSFEEEFTARLRGSLSDPLIDALHRRSRYLAWVDRSSSDIAVHVADVGRGRTY
ncbi:MAG: hypothetical protein JWM49_1085 [Microbacteriaceae bacterium]|nr:hypothetical protein [Microbacteriaceae bacterium]